MIFKATTTDTKRGSITIKQVLKLKNSSETLERFEKFREDVKNRALKHCNKNPRNTVDGNEQLLFYDINLTCCKPSELSDFCKNSNCSICRIIQSGSNTARKKTGIWLSTSCQDIINMNGLERELEAAEKWREALEEAAALAGWELKNTADGHEAKFIQKIVEEISLESRSINFSNDGKLIGMESRIKDVLSSLEMGFHDVHMIGIKGIGGGGKTTLARAVFDQISTWFEGKSFVENVREVSKTSLSGLKSLQKQVLSDVLNVQGIKVSSVDDGKNLMKKMMCGRKVLLVLDDVDHTDQLEALAGELNWFKSGSRIIITTRDEQVLIAHRVNLIHDVNLLSDEEAICLFNRYAFGREVPIQGHEEELSEQVVHYAAGLPLTIRVLGSFLCGKNEHDWKDALERLKTIPLKETLEKLELSYISLEADYKEIFLNVACMLKGWRKEEAIKVLESCGFYARNASVKAGHSLLATDAIAQTVTVESVTIEFSFTESLGCVFFTKFSA
ncbi:hypothetical protein L6452_28810 [Arctium lappa]|uniref:Uncharacterized protein n=1 Tax=Arctium lappa TaxID=4217 RepID=A0ACB8ZZG6_ARCLA|nr:hypothetical protein L6452_28810 [Arctium lappa]